MKPRQQQLPANFIHLEQIIIEDYIIIYFLFIEITKHTSYRILMITVHKLTIATIICYQAHDKDLPLNVVSMDYLLIPCS